MMLGPLFTGLCLAFLAQAALAQPDPGPQPELSESVVGQRPTSEREAAAAEKIARLLEFTYSRTARG